VASYLRWKLGDGRGFLVGMLGDGCGQLVELAGRVFDGGRVEQLAAELVEMSDGGGGHGEVPPASTGSVEHGPDQAETGTLAWQPTDDLDPPAGLAEGPLD